MDTLVTTSEMVVFLVLAVMLGFAAAAARYLWGVGAAAVAVQGDPRFAEVARRIGINFAAVEDERTLRGAAIGVRRCVACRHRQACDAWLADPGHKGIPPNCPNEQFLRAQLRSR